MSGSQCWFGAELTLRFQRAQHWHTNPARLARSLTRSACDNSLEDATIAYSGIQNKRRPSAFPGAKPRERLINDHFQRTPDQLVDGLLKYTNLCTAYQLVFHPSRWRSLLKDQTPKESAFKDLQTRTVRPPFIMWTRS